jgi:hypothetical protein
MVSFIIHKYFTTNFIFMRRIRELHVTGLRIEFHKFFYTKTTMKKCSLKSKKE